MLCHNPGSPAQNHPGQQGADDGVSNARPGGGDAVAPAELPGISHEHNGREIGSAVGESGEPGAHGAASQHKAVHIGGMLAAVKSNACQHYKVQDQQKQFHGFSPLAV